VDFHKPRHEHSSNEVDCQRISFFTVPEGISRKLLDLLFEKVSASQVFFPESNPIQSLNRTCYVTA
jgi:hypothetical protein